MSQRDLQNQPKIAPPDTFEWGSVIASTGMTGIVAMLARHSALVGYDARIPFLAIEIHEQLRPIAEDGALIVMKEHLHKFFGSSIDLRVSYGTADACLAMAAQKQSIEAVSATMVALMEDDFIRDVNKQFGAVVFVDSISSDMSFRRPAH